MLNLREILQDINGATFIGLSTTTQVKLTGGKKNPMQGRITKKMFGTSVMAFQNKNANGYENMVKRRLENEGLDPQSFAVGPRAWGQRVANLPIVEHNGKEYLEVIFIKPGKTQYMLDGVEYDGEIEGLQSNSINEDGQGGIENKVIIRTFAVDSIDSITVDGNTFLR